MNLNTEELVADAAGVAGSDSIHNSMQYNPHFYSLCGLHLKTRVRESEEVGERYLINHHVIVLSFCIVCGLAKLSSVTLVLRLLRQTAVNTK